MYKLPADFDGSFLKGKKLSMIAFSENSVVFHFEQNVSVCVLSSFIHSTDLSEELVTLQRVPVTDSTILQLLGHVTINVSSDPDGTLSMMFENGHSLKVFDDSSNYESYLISNGEEEIIV